MRLPTIVLLFSTAGCSQANLVPPRFMTPYPRSDWDTTSKKFSARVAARYPVGTPSRDVASDLRAQGFAAPFYNRLGEGWWEAVRNRHHNGWMCAEGWSVRWQVDDRDRVKEAWGTWGDGCHYGDGRPTPWARRRKAGE